MQSVWHVYGTGKTTRLALLRTIQVACARHTALTNLGLTGVDPLYLIQQGFSGTVSNYSASGSQATFTLTLATDSAFATLTGTTTITAYQQPGTQLSGLTSVTNGATIRLRGLLFRDSRDRKLEAHEDQRRSADA